MRPGLRAVAPTRRPAFSSPSSATSVGFRVARDEERQPRPRPDPGEFRPVFARQCGSESELIEKLMTCTLGISSIADLSVLEHRGVEHVRRQFTASTLSMAAMALAT